MDLFVQKIREKTPFFYHAYRNAVVIYEREEAGRLLVGAACSGA